MVNGSRYYRAMESVSIASALSSANFTHARSESINADSLNSPTSYSSEERVAAGHSGQFTPCGYLSTLWHTHYFSRPRTRNLPIVGSVLVRRATSSATDSPNVSLIEQLSDRNCKHRHAAIKFKTIKSEYNEYSHNCHITTFEQYYWVSAASHTEVVENQTAWT